MNLREKIAAKQAELLALKDRIAHGDAEAIKASEALVKELEQLEDLLAKAEAAERKLEAMGGNQSAGEDEQETVPAKTLGENFAKALSKYNAKSGSHFTVVAPEFKAATDVQMVPSSVANALTTIDRNVVELTRTKLVIRDLFGAETISGNALEFYIEGAMEGSGPAVTAEGAQKPQVHFANPDKVTVTLAKIAAFIKESDEYIEDAAFLASSINGRLLYQLFLAEQNYLVAQLVATSGIQTDTASWTAATTATQLAEIVFGALMDVEEQSGYSADAIVLNPAVWQILRLGKDANGQYYGGGYFADGEGKQLWGVPVVTTSAVTANQIMVGAFKTSASVVSKGGYSVEATNSDQDDFIRNRMTIRAEERLALAVRRPAGFKLITKKTS